MSVARAHHAVSCPFLPGFYDPERDQEIPGIVCRGQTRARSQIFRSFLCKSFLSSLGGETSVRIIFQWGRARNIPLHKRIGKTPSVRGIGFEIRRASPQRKSVPGIHWPKLERISYDTIEKPTSAVISHRPPSL